LLSVRVAGRYHERVVEEARARFEAALDGLVEGRAGSFEALWSGSDDTVIMGALAATNAGGNKWPGDSSGQARESEPQGDGPRTCSLSSAKTSRAPSTSNIWSAPSMAVPTTGFFAVPRFTGWKAAGGK